MEGLAPPLCPVPNREPLLLGDTRVKLGAGGGVKPPIGNEPRGYEPLQRLAACPCYESDAIRATTTYARFVALLKGPGSGDMSVVSYLGSLGVGAY